MRNIYTIIVFCLFAMSCSPKQSETPWLQDSAFEQVTDSAAHWLNADTLFWYGEAQSESSAYYLLATTADKQAETKSYLLETSPFSSENSIKYPHLAGKGLAFKFATTFSDSEKKALLKSALVLAKVSKDKVLKSSYVQTGNVIDALFSDSAKQVADLGATFTNKTAGPLTQFKLWAPTAMNVEVLVFDQHKKALATYPLTEDTSTGIWSAQIGKNLFEHFYQYQIKVFHNATNKIETLINTDPYSLSLSSNSEFSQVTDLSHSATKPEGWDEQIIPSIDNYEDNIFYELHIRDFSAGETALNDESVRGKYGAFSETNSFGVKHLKELKAAGLNNIHLLPTFDIGTVNEDREQRVSLQDDKAKLCKIYPEHSLCSTDIAGDTLLIDVLNSYNPESSDAQQLVSQLRQFDDYNWGYDPFHYTVPEGSYAQNPDGNARIVEFRQMVQRLHQFGFRVIMDVVYNHTHQAGLKRTSVLDKIVPGYYQRLNPQSGLIEQSTCCDNTATERTMMAKLMTDSLVVWARDYKIDGFRFDLMAHQPKDVMLKAREAVLAVDADNYFYGEGWNFGEVANNQRFTQASQLELGGTQIGTFTDRLRDAVRGGGMTESGDGIRRLQGIGNGLATLPNELRSVADSKADYLAMADILRVGLAGNLASFPLQNAAGEQVTGKDIPYGDQPAGYALDPADTINYVSKHDNQTLWDNNQYRINSNLSTDDRVRMQALSLSYPMFAQGIPFIHMGSELLRSKSFLRDSYDYGDWFNLVDFSGQSNNYNVGLPPAEKDQQNWQVINKIIQQNQGRDIVAPAHIAFSKSRFVELLNIRTSSPLFRLTTSEQINSAVSFLNTGRAQTLGLIVMKIDGSKLNADLSSKYEQIIVVFNSTGQEQKFAYNGAENYQLHPVQAASSDTLTSNNKATAKGFSVNKFSAAVFVK
ncbi:pullulanase-type alpha-1,6-glucosidase [Thalassomonas sp. M1454]|uniref:pullulanase-type alpha-1,6-glucosidase n=1 Tax=Thalassomonas sp. M1454 TaxID=2594477 RepID=UPI001180211B|nr:pullulanase-type alpha-1,6-glucosidase [Thalassomonas sp. M1454]TRX58065.1 pullulanase-type alpha-1,6-glucosidase [Thalassomonas sp. M1454]